MTQSDLSGPCLQHKDIDEESHVAVIYQVLKDNLRKVPQRKA